MHLFLSKEDLLLKLKLGTFFIAWNSKRKVLGYNLHLQMLVLFSQLLQRTLKVLHICTLIAKCFCTVFFCSCPHLHCHELAQFLLQQNTSSLVCVSLFYSIWLMLSILQQNIVMYVNNLAANLELLVRSIQQPSTTMLSMEHCSV